MGQDSRTYQEETEALHALTFAFAMERIDELMAALDSPAAEPATDANTEGQ